MSASIAQIGFGMKLSFSTTSGGAYTDLVEIIEIKPFGLKIGKSPSTHHASPNVAEEYSPSTIDYSEVEATVSWSKTEYPALTALKRQALFWKVTYPDVVTTTGSTDVFPGFITEVQPATPLKERMTCQIKIQPTGLSTFTAST